MKPNLNLCLAAASLLLLTVAGPASALNQHRTVTHNGTTYLCDFDSRDALALEELRFDADQASALSTPTTTQSSAAAAQSAAIVNLDLLCGQITVPTVGAQACPDEIIAGSGKWVYTVAYVVRDPVQPGTFYPAAWTGLKTYVYDAEFDTCLLVSRQCTIVVASDVWFYDGTYTPSGSWTYTSSGTWHGVPVTNVNADCSNEHASASGMVAGLVPISGSA